MKKLLISLSLVIILLTGCGVKMNTPTAKVEEFFGKYQSMDSSVLAQLDSIISNDAMMNDEQKNDYKAIMEKQYQNISYKIKNEEINGETATVTAEIEVFDYVTSINESEKYYNEHKDEFMNNKSEENDSKNDDTNTNDNGNDKDDNSIANEVGDLIDSSSKYIDYKIKQLKDVTNKKKYDITFYLTKDNGEWILENISDIDRQKIHGLYED